MRVKMGLTAFGALGVLALVGGIAHLETRSQLNVTGCRTSYQIECIATDTDGWKADAIMREDQAPDNSALGGLIWLARAR